MKGLYYFLISLFSIICVSQNNTKTDSILNSLKSSNNLKNNVHLYLDLSIAYQSIDLDSAVYFGKVGYKLADSLNYNLGIAEISSKLGDIYVKQNNLDSANTYYTKAINFYRETDSLFKYTENTLRSGNIYLAQNNYLNALKLYQECLKISKENQFSILIPHLYNNIGLLYKEIEDYDDAESNFKNAYELFLENKDEANSVYPLYNIASIHSILGRDEEAINENLNLVSYHLKTENWVSLASVYNSISEIYLKNNDNERAKEYLEMALKAVEDKSDSFNTGPSTYWQSGIYTNAANVYFKLGQYDNAKKYGKKAMDISEKNSYLINIVTSSKIIGDIYDIEKQKDSTIKYYKIYIDKNIEFRNEDDIKQLTKLKMQNELDEIIKQNEIDNILQEARYKNRELRFIGIAGFSLLLVIILILLYLNQKNKNVKLKLIEENLVLEKNKLNQDLEYKKKELTSNMMYLMEKNEFITSISKKLIELKPDAKKDNKDLIQQIINEIRQNSNAKIWEEFEVRFKEVHDKFYKALHKAHPDLTLNEIKICAFLRLNMSTKDISAITHQSVKTINMARFRLRKKLNIDRDDNLIAYLNSL